MLSILTKPIIGTPHIPAAKLGMGLSVLTLAPGLSEFCLGVTVAMWLVYLLTRLLSHRQFSISVRRVRLWA